MVVIFRSNQLAACSSQILFDIGELRGLILLLCLKMYVGYWRKYFMNQGTYFIKSLIDFWPLETMSIWSNLHWSICHEWQHHIPVHHLHPNLMNDVNWHTARTRIPMTLGHFLSSFHLTERYFFVWLGISVEFAIGYPLCRDCFFNLLIPKSHFYIHSVRDVQVLCKLDAENSIIYL